MEIVIVLGKIRKSKINGERVEDLPEGLQAQVKHLLLILSKRGVRVISINGDGKDAIFGLSKRNVTLSHYNGEIKKEFLKVVGLALWYFERHFYSSHRGAIGAPVYCADCNRMQAPGVHEYCDNPGCPSHEKWKEILGPSYKPPKKSIFPGVTLKEIKEIKKILRLRE